MSIKEFNELVRDFGANGVQNPELLSESKWQIVALAWAASNKIEDKKEADSVIYSYFRNFLNA